MKQAVKKHTGFYFSSVGQDSFQIHFRVFSFAGAKRKVRDTANGEEQEVSIII